MKRTANHVIKECIHMTSEEGHYFYKSAGDDATVCGIYFVTAPNMLVQVHFDYLDVPCATGGLIAFVDGWELNGGYFPAVEDHELPLSERVNEFCGLTPPTRTFLSSQNAALLQYRVPKRSRGFSFKVTFVKNPAHHTRKSPRSMNYPGLDAASVRSKIKILRSCYISSRKQIASKAGYFDASQAC
ncbi:hypothetical protein GE061_017435 [Apolygus lucorum]|uniref:Corticotropin-releasing factor-binding protein n=1 Tax=Apolygus lucorum TaxID=248454 RepID=A0A8S9XDP9_APOLU|nr:hypothetical protein GE061_017435 [Apolygus lucorum]